MTSNRRTEFALFILDVLDFMEEKTREAVEDEASRAGAISEAAGVVPQVRDRVRKNEVTQAQFMLVFDVQMSEPPAAQWWAEFARMDRKRDFRDTLVGQPIISRISVKSLTIQNILWHTGRLTTYCQGGSGSRDNSSHPAHRAGDKRLQNAFREIQSEGDRAQNPRRG